MIEHKNIDRLFQEKFRDFEETPTAHIWKNIESELSDNSRKKRGLWLWIGSIAAGLALLITLNNTYTGSNQTTPKTTETNTKVVKNPIIPKTEVATTKTEINTPIEKITLPKTTNPKETIATTTQSNPTYTPIYKTTLNKKTATASNTTTQPIVANFEKKTSEKSPNTVPVIDPQKEIAGAVASNLNTEIAQQDKLKTKTVLPNKTEKEEVIAQVPTEKTKQKAVKTTTETALTLAQNEDTTDKKVSKNKWSISTLAAPMYLSSFNQEVSSIDKSFDQNVKQGVFSKAYGVQVAYAISDKLSVQTGLQLVDYGHRTYDVYVSPSGHVSEFSTINYDEVTNIEVSATPDTPPTDVYQTFSMGETGDLIQVFGYIEVPIEAKYKIVTGNFGINAIGGFSTLILNKNKIYIETENFSNEIGNGVSNLNTLNFSGNLGIELDYKLYKDIHFNLTPIFKVHANTFAKDTQGFSPYALGIYSGLNYRF